MGHDCTVKINPIDGILDQPFEALISGLPASREITVDCQQSSRRNIEAWNIMLEFLEKHLR